MDIGRFDVLRLFVQYIAGWEILNIYLWDFYKNFLRE
ncbi:hypothetical protein BOM_0263 [Borrelia miyamotoi FR64b]|nr:hypothetical protein BOM_0263 [Borrelia miyamotoi FR64b]